MHTVVVLADADVRCRRVLDSDVLVNISTIAADYGMSGCELNRLLGELKVQYRFNNKGRWYLYKKYKDKG